MNIFGIYNIVLGPLLKLKPLYSIAIISVALSLLFTILQKKLVNQEKVNYIKSEMEKIKKQVDKTKGKGKEKEQAKLLEKQLKLTQQHFMINLKPLIASLVVLSLLLPWLRYYYSVARFKIPFAIPLLAPNAVIGWLGAYIIISIPTTIILKKLLDVM